MKSTLAYNEIRAPEKHGSLWEQRSFSRPTTEDLHSLIITNANFLRASMVSEDLLCANLCMCFIYPVSLKGQILKITFKLSVSFPSKDLNYTNNILINYMVTYLEYIYFCLTKH